MRCTISIKFDVEDLKNIPICDLLYIIAFDIVGPLLETNDGNKYILVVIDHYYKWCEAKTIPDYTTTTTTKFLEAKIFTDMKYLNLFSSTMVVNGLLNLITCAKSMIFTIHTPCHNGLDVTGWPKGLSKPLNMELQ